MRKIKWVKGWIPENFRNKAKMRAAEKGMTMGAFLSEISMGSEDDWKAEFNNLKRGALKKNKRLI